MQKTVHHLFVYESQLVFFRRVDQSDQRLLLLSEVEVAQKGHSGAHHHPGSHCHSGGLQTQAAESKLAVKIQPLHSEEGLHGKPVPPGQGFNVLRWTDCSDMITKLICWTDTTHTHTETTDLLPVIKKFLKSSPSGRSPWLRAINAVPLIQPGDLFTYQTVIHDVRLGPPPPGAGSAASLEEKRSDTPRVLQDSTVCCKTCLRAICAYTPAALS